MTLKYEMQGLYTDRYELEMAQAYWQEGRKDERSVFDFCFRTNPFGGTMAVFAGLETLLEAIRAFRFPDATLAYLSDCGFPEDFLEFLSAFQFRGTVTSVREGEVVFPLEPCLRIEGGIIETQILETLVLNVLNFQTLIATKAARCCRQAGGRHISEFGLRRAQGLGGLWASRAAAIGGCTSTSNMDAGRRFGIPVVGTMAHSFVQSYDNELEAFRAFARVKKGSNTILLLDTYNTLKSGLPNAIKVATELANRGESLRGVRLDSGDLACLARECRKRLDAAGFSDTLIVASNQIDEWIIRSLNEQLAPIDLFGIGTKLVVGDPDGALDGVYKLSFLNGKPRMKFSDTLKKESLPGRKSVTRYSDAEGPYRCDAIHLEGESPPERMVHPWEPDKQMFLDGLRQETLLKKAMVEGEIIGARKSVREITAFAQSRLERLPDEHFRLENPSLYKVGLSPDLNLLRTNMKTEFKYVQEQESAAVG